LPLDLDGIAGFIYHFLHEFGPLLVDAKLLELKIARMFVVYSQSNVYFSYYCLKSMASALMKVDLHVHTQAHMTPFFLPAIIKIAMEAGLQE
jgi:hypothetical protein